MKYHLPIINSIVSMEIEYEILAASQCVEDKDLGSVISVGQEVVEINQNEFLNTWE